MRVCVVGLWHLGTVTAGCLAAAGYDVVGLDSDTATIERLRDGRAPLLEPGLDTLLRDGLEAGRLRFETVPGMALRGAEVAWVTYDTPVDDQDQADTAFVVERVSRLFPFLEPGMLVLISSQVPIGTTRRLERAYAAAHPERTVTFGYSPENLRLGRAVDAFVRPDRVVVGVRNEGDRARIERLLRPFTERIAWMSVESAEMTKHALNAFLATSVAFANEVAVLCEVVGADAKEVERGLKTDARIGPRAYLSPGAAFAGGTLARDLVFLEEVARSRDLPAHLLAAVRTSNEVHKQWVHRSLQSALGDLAGQRVAVWGLTYTPDTDTLRRSLAIELCRWLAAQGAEVRAHDPAVTRLPGDVTPVVTLLPTPVAALSGSTALVVATEWPAYRSVGPDEVVAAMRSPLVVDPNRFLAATLGGDPRIRYAAVGSARR